MSEAGDLWSLEFDGALPSDSGCYICVAENPAGKVFCTARLSVDGLAVLEFSPMTWDDAGEYKCVAENESGESSFVIQLQLSDPPTFLEPIQDLMLASHVNGKLTCRVDGIPKPSVKFLKDWKPLSETPRYKCLHLVMSISATSPEFVEPAKVHHGIDSRPVQLSLQLIGYPLPTVQWYFNNKKIVFGDKYDGYVTPSGQWFKILFD
uniref:Immunoglobulin I-set domain-containing protein n=1 Tax=Biomphalaria glabrata TaxID=6526 RepID=A0A2C9KQ17_BIOGL